MSTAIKPRRRTLNQANKQCNITPGGHIGKCIKPTLARRVYGASCSTGLSITLHVRRVTLFITTRTLRHITSCMGERKCKGNQRL